MRIAVSGTHCSGKSTLIEAFLKMNVDYAHEPEAYIVLQEEYGEAFADDPSADDYFRQLEFAMARLHEYKSGDRVIFERSPIDYVAYLLALQNMKREGADESVSEGGIRLLRKSISLIEAIVYVSAAETDDIVPDSEDPDLRTQVDEQLQAILLSDKLNLFEFGSPMIVEVSGTTAQRLSQLNRAVSSE